MSAFFIILPVIFVALYFILILSFFIGWIRKASYCPDGIPAAIRVSILIPCKNEAENIPELAKLLNNQVYPRELLEIIWINDHSDDGTTEILSGLVQNHDNMHLVNPDRHLRGKKAALQAGMKRASGQLILLTDADSRPGLRWVLTLAKFFEDTGSDLILGPVVLDPAPGWFGQIQKLEYLSLVAASIGAAGLGHPVMAQGPNIGVRATDYMTIVKDLDNRYASGDDVFLLQAMKKMRGKKIRYVLNPDAIVRSKPAKSLSGFFRQRQRWASKSTGYRDPAMILTTVVVFLANLDILIALLAALAGWSAWLLPIILLSIKSIADLILLIPVSKYFRCSNLLIWFLPLQVIYPFYIVLAAGLSIGGKVKWR